MTCIVAIADGKNVVIGGDSAGVDGRHVQIRADAKVFRKGSYVIGFTTSFRMGQILRYETALPELPPDTTDPDELEHFFVTRFIPAVRQSFEDHGFAKTTRFNHADQPSFTEEGQSSGGTFLVGAAGHTFEIRNDYQLGRSATPYSAVGSGAMVALGALRALEEVEGLSLHDRLVRALETAETYSTGVRAPFRVVNLAAESTA